MKTILAALMMVLSTAAYGQLVKCVSKDGKVEYARDCPAGTTEQKTNIRSGAAASGGGTATSPPAAKSLAERDADFKKRQIEQQEAQQKADKSEAVDKQKRDACENARLYLKNLEEGQRVRKTDPKTGEQVFLDDAERTAEVNRQRGRVADICK